MTTTTRGPVSAATQWLRGLWEYYRGYSQTALHAVTAATLSAFGLLVFVNPLFAILAIASYVCPPVALYVLDADAGKPESPSELTADSAPAAVDTASPTSDAAPAVSAAPTADATLAARVDSGDGGDGDSDSDDGDGDSDGDSDGDDGDGDSDSDDGDGDSDG